ncbi:glycosyltransferase family A protein [Melittangium boletus]|uniref:glycosyltransferase family A protein n=1 Tax=Melittangium boletus TaxID=83453 RepID=UPI003DA56948
MKTSPGRDASVALSTHLHDWVLARVAPDSRVALMAPTPALVAALEARACSRLVLTEGPAEALAPEARASLERFAPTHVVLPAHSTWPLATWLETLRLAAPRAEVLWGFWNAGGAAGLLATLLGQAPGRAGPSDVEVTRLLRAEGFEVRGREARPAPPGTPGLASATEDSLRALLTQLSASAEADLLLYAVAPMSGARVEAPALVPGLLSVVVDATRSEHPGSLDETLFSLACQDHAAVEVLLVGDTSGTPLPEGLTTTRYGTVRQALAGARGQYLAFLDAGSVIYPRHYARLLDTLGQGTAAWALARAFRATCRPGLSGRPPYIEGKRPFPLGERPDTAHLLAEPELLQALVIDRTRVGPLSLEPEALLPRLCGLFPPVFLAEGIATCEVRSLLETPPAPRALAPSMRMLLPLSTLVETLAHARAEGALSRGRVHRVVDELNTRLREGLPWLHGALRSAAQGRRR